MFGKSCSGGVKDCGPGDGNVCFDAMLSAGDLEKESRQYFGPFCTFACINDSGCLGLLREGTCLQLRKDMKGRGPGICYMKGAANSPPPTVAVPSLPAASPPAASPPPIHPIFNRMVRKNVRIKLNYSYSGFAPERDDGCLALKGSEVVAESCYPYNASQRWNIFQDGRWQVRHNTNTYVICTADSTVDRCLTVGNPFDPSRPYSREVILRPLDEAIATGFRWLYEADTLQNVGNDFVCLDARPWDDAKQYRPVASWFCKNYWWSLNRWNQRWSF
jgi:hypothetical protein